MTETTNSDQQEPDDSPRSAQRRVLPKIVRFEELDPCGEEIWIENGGQIYRLRRTRQGKHTSAGSETRAQRDSAALELNGLSIFDPLTTLVRLPTLTTALGDPLFLQRV